MIYVKVSNLFTSRGNADYKGLDLDKIVPNTQLYPEGENYCIVGYDGDLPANADLAEVTETDHTALKDQINSTNPTVSLPDQLMKANEQIALMQKALDSLILGV